MKKYIILFTAIFAINSASAQFCSARINALSALTGTLDVGIDIAITDNITFDVAAQYNPLKLNAFSLSHYGAEIGAKYWVFENFVGHFMGAHLGYTNYDIGNEKSRYDGNAFRWGVSYGYAWILSVHCTPSANPILPAYFGFSTFALKKYEQSKIQRRAAGVAVR